MTTPILALLLWPILAALFVGAIWSVYRSHRFGLVALSAIAVSLVYGYLSYRLFCSHPLVCDVGGPSNYAISVTLHFATQAAAGCSAAIVFVAFSQQPAAASSLSLRALGLGALVAIGATYLVSAVLSLFWPWPL